MAVKVTRSFTATQRGIGKPDYTREVSSAQERRGLKLAYKQTLEIWGIVFSAIPSPFAWVAAPLIPGGIAHYIDNVTGLVLPFTVPQGYTLTLIAAGGGFTEDAIAWVYFGTPPAPDFLVLSGGLMGGGQSGYENRLVGISTATIDPTGATAHTVDIQLTNLGTGNLEGGVEWTGILEEVGTPALPTTKVVRCKWCGYEQTVPREVTRIICPRCGQLTLYYDLSQFRRTP